MTMTSVHGVMHANVTWQTHTQRLLWVLNIRLSVNRLSIVDHLHDTKSQHVTHDKREMQWPMANGTNRTIFDLVACTLECQVHGLNDIHSSNRQHNQSILHTLSIIYVAKGQHCNCNNICNACKHDMTSTRPTVAQGDQHTSDNQPSIIGHLHGKNGRHVTHTKMTEAVASGNW